MIRRIRIVISLLLVLSLLMISVFSVSAIDNKYYLSDLKMTVRIPNQYYTVTRDSDRDDENFKALGLDYDETMTAFYAANIYLQAQNEGKNIKISVVMTQDDNSKAVMSYNKLKDDELQQVINTYQEGGVYKDGTITKHNGFKCLDFKFERDNDDKKIYGSMVNTVINGMNLNFTIQKDNEDLLPDEEKVLTNMVNTMSFDKIIDNGGPSFEWWRVLIWIVTMAVIIFIIYFVYHRVEQSKKRQRNMRKRTRRSDDSYLIGDKGYSEDLLNPEKIGDLTYDESKEDDVDLDKLLGYSDKRDYVDRSLNDIDNLDIKVKEKREKSGIDYFEDDGGKISSGEDYFEKYFTEEREHRNAGVKAADAAATYTKIGAKKLGNFVKNVSSSVKEKSNKNRNKDQ